MENNTTAETSTKSRVYTAEARELNAAKHRERYWQYPGAREAKANYYRNVRAAIIKQRYQENRTEILAKLQVQRNAKKAAAANETAVNKI